MPKLRDGTKVKDGRLARMKEFDERSREFPISELMKGKKMRSYSWECNRHFNQGEQGACVGFAFTHELIAKPAPVTGLSGRFAVEKVYWAAQRKDPWKGGAYPEAKPKYDGTSILTAVKVVRAMGYFEQFRWAFGIEDLIMAVGHIGPAVLGLPWYVSMAQPHRCGFLHLSLVDEEYEGDHAVLCKAVNVRERSFVIHNSWGSSWGVKGDARISWDDMERLLHAGGEACVPLYRHKSR
ncbi:MAG: hypothetical protein KC431_14335 [Myxococcales bacterium]|nr:hypothetical protein [Myxococcales bacterium]